MTSEDFADSQRKSDVIEHLPLTGRFHGDLDHLSGRSISSIDRDKSGIGDSTFECRDAIQRAVLKPHNMTIFSEIVDATAMTVDQVVERSRKLRADGADVIDLGCLPDSPFPHLEATIEALHADGARVSVDSFDSSELSRATKAGADFLLSLSERNIAIADEGPAVPILVGKTTTDMDSLHAVIDTMLAKGKPFYADPILDPIHYGFTPSVARYYEMRRRRPDVPILMGVGNLTELTDADTSGINALLMGICSELNITAVLTVQASPHCRTAIKEFDYARREYHAAKNANALPAGLNDGLMPLRNRSGFSCSPETVAELAGTYQETGYRIEVAEDGVHAFNTAAHHVDRDPFDLYPKLNMRGSVGYAFYLGAEIARAEIAHKLGKRYAQDQSLEFGTIATTKASAANPLAMELKDLGNREIAEGLADTNRDNG